MLFDRALTRPTARITAAYVATHQVGAGVLPELIASIAASISAASANAPDTIPAGSSPRLTAAQIRKSITPKALISFEDGKPYRTLKRHLSARGLTIAAYRTKWGLPDNYPAVCPDYSAMRSGLARKIGLGRRTPAARATAKDTRAAVRNKASINKEGGAKAKLGASKGRASAGTKMAAESAAASVKRGPRTKTR